MIARGGLSPLDLLDLGDSRPLHADLIRRALPLAEKVVADERKALAIAIAQALDGKEPS